MERFDFNQGLPDPDSIPLEQLAEAASETMLRDGFELRRYPAKLGLTALREVALRRIASRGSAGARLDDVVLTSGALQAIGLAASALAAPGDSVIVEERTYALAMRIIRRHGLRLVPVPMDDRGLRVDALANVLAGEAARGAPPKLAYLIPTHHNPTGVTLAAERRLPLLDLTRAHGVTVIEDDCYADICFEPACAPTLHSLAPESVVYVGSFSKLLAPGFRLGYFAAAPELRDRMLAHKNDGGTSDVSARIAARYLDRNLDDHVRRVRRIVQGSSQVMEAALDRHLAPAGSRWLTPTGGYFFWVELPPGLSPRALAGVAAERGLAYGSGRDYDVAGADIPYVRLCITSEPADRIDPGIAVLGDCLGRAASMRQVA